jgi:uncharacterized protein (TIGR02118 family)
MLKIIGMYHFRPDLPLEQCMRHWTVVHPNVVRRTVPGVRRYVQDVPLRMSRRPWPYSAVSELWFDDMAAIKTAYGSPELAAERMADEASFMTQDYSWLIAEERIQW